MTELIIDGVSAVLSKDFSIQVKRENPLFTKNGEYTYDITLPLDNPTNAELYKHLNRLNSTQTVSTDRRAVLVADNRVYCNGTEVITGWTEDTVSIQIASGNSELNWFIGADLSISTLEMKQTIVPTAESEKLNYIQNTYPEVDYCLAPIVNQTNNYVFNAWGLKEGQELPVEQSDTTYIPQPYLCPYIKEVVNALGYTLVKNELEDTVFRELYICHALHTDHWNEILPEWSVKDFLEQIEQLFDMTFVVDNKSRTASLIFNNRFLDGSHTAHVAWVEDVYETEVEEDPDKEDMADSNVSYSLGDDEFWKFACLADEVKEAAKYEHIPEDYVSSNTRFSRVMSWFHEDGMVHQRTDTIYIDDSDGRQYLWMGEPEENGRGKTYRMVDAFAQLEREGTDTKVELNVKPVTLAEVSFTREPGEGTEDRQEVTLHLPAINEGTDVENETEEEGPTPLPNLIRNGAEAEDANSTLSLALYSGLTDIYVSGSSHSYPIPYIDEYRDNEHTNPTFQVSSEYVKTNSVGATLRLSYLDELIYQSTYDIDYKHAIKISSHDPNLYDARYIFEIRNKRYVCREMEFTLDAHGRKGAWTGTFYPIHISDTEADARWVLTDGKWRDGGVWLDNGRWLDE